MSHEGNRPAQGSPVLYLPFDCGVVFFLSYAFFLLNLHPSLPWGDGPELITASASLGVPHPPGYPLYVLLGHLAYLVPIGNAAFRLNLLSALFGALAATIIRASLDALSPNPRNATSRAAYTAGALLLCTLPVYFSAARSAEVYTLLALFMSACLFFVFSLQQNVSVSGHAVWFLGGLALLHHYLVLPVVVWLLLRRNRWNPVCILIPAMLAFVPMIRSRAGVALDWYRPSTFDALLRLLMGGEFAQNLASGWQVFQAYPLKSLFVACVDLVSAWGPFFPFVCVGVWVLARRSMRHAAEYTLLLTAYAVFYLFYLVGDREVFTLPFVILATPLVCLGLEWAVVSLGRGLSPRARILLFLLVLLLPLWQARRVTVSHAIQDPMEAFRYSESVLSLLPPDAVLLAGLHEPSQDNEVFPLAYQQIVERRRPDVDVIGAGFLALPWYREELSRRGLNLDLCELPLGKYASPEDWYVDVWRGIVTVVDRPVCSTVPPAYMAETRGVEVWGRCDSQLLLQLPSFADRSSSPYLPWGTVFRLMPGEE